MKKWKWIMAGLFLFLFASPCFADGSAQNAIKVLKRLESKCQAGITYRDYLNALADAKFDCGKYLKSADASKNKALTQSIKKVVEHYQYALATWEMRFDYKNEFLSIDHPSISVVLKHYPGAYKNIEAGGAFSEQVNMISIPSLVKIIWSEASKELAETVKLSKG